MRAPPSQFQSQETISSSATPLPVNGRPIGMDDTRNISFFRKITITPFPSSRSSYCGATAKATAKQATPTSIAECVEPEPATNAAEHAHHEHPQLGSLRQQCECAEGAAQAPDRQWGCHRRWRRIHTECGEGDHQWQWISPTFATASNVSRTATPERQSTGQQCKSSDGVVNSRATEKIQFMLVFRVALVIT